MKRVLKKMAAFFAAFLMVFTLVGCDKSKSIKKAYEKEGFTVSVVNTKDNSTVSSLLGSVLSAEQKEAIDEYDVIFCTKNLTQNAVIIKFPSAKDLKNFLIVEDDDGNKDTSAYDSAKENGRIKGNCWFAAGNTVDIFKKA